jgi:histone H3/H4
VVRLPGVMAEAADHNGALAEVIAASGATQENARTALDAAGGNVQHAISFLVGGSPTAAGGGRKRQAPKQFDPTPAESTHRPKKKKAKAKPAPKPKLVLKRPATSKKPPTPAPGTGGMSEQSSEQTPVPAKAPRASGGKAAAGSKPAASASASGGGKRTSGGGKSHENVLPSVASGVASTLSLPVAAVRSFVDDAFSMRNMKPEALLVVTKATELFAEFLTEEAYRYTAGDRRTAIKYSDVAMAVAGDSRIKFLEDMVPPMRQTKVDEGGADSSVVEPTSVNEIVTDT